MDDDARFEPGEPLREVALVVLEAVALPRRLSRSPQWPSTLEPDEWQVLLAIALGGAAAEPEGALTPAGLARALALTLDDVADALYDLQRMGLASISFRDPDRSEVEQEWSPTASGAAAAVEMLAFAGRVMRWPPVSGWSR